MTAATYYLPWEPLQEAAQGAFAGAGSPPEEAALIAGRLIKASLTGHDSHGAIRIHQYLERLRNGIIQPGQTNVTVRETPSTALYSAQRGYGQPAATQAMNAAIDKARAHSVAAVGLIEVNHIGRLADYAVMAAEAGMVGLVFTSDGGAGTSVAYHGAAQGRVSTNPIAAAFPSDRAAPVVLDMATSVWANGKFMVRRAANAPIPPGMLIDADGHPTTDAHVLGNGGAIRPLGGPQGYKGSLLAFWVEALAGALTGGGIVGDGPRPIVSNTTTMIVLNVAAYRELPAFKAELEGLIARLKDVPTLPGQEVLYPGEVEARKEAERRRNGIPLAENTLADLQGELERYGVPMELAPLALSRREGAAAG